MFLLTDDEPTLLAGGTGLTLERSEEADDLLLDDLRSDVGMEWVPEDMWLSYLTLDAPAAELDYDLAVSTEPGRDAVAGRRRGARGGRRPVLPAGRGGAGVAVAVAAVAGVGAWPSAGRRRSVAPTARRSAGAGRGPAGGGPGRRGRARHGSGG